MQKPWYPEDDDKTENVEPIPENELSKHLGSKVRAYRTGKVERKPYNPMLTSCEKCGDWILHEYRGIERRVQRIAGEPKQLEPTMQKVELYRCTQCGTLRQTGILR
jgi:hypothetical protein